MKIAQEEDRVPGRRILIAMAVSLVLSALGVLCAWGLAVSEPGVPRVSAPSDIHPLVPLPAAKDIEQARRELFAERPLGADLRAPKELRLQRYGWVDERAGVIHIPIARAMELYVQARGQQRPPSAPSSMMQGGAGRPGGAGGQVQTVEEEEP